MLKQPCHFKGPKISLWGFFVPAFGLASQICPSCKTLARSGSDMSKVQSLLTFPHSKRRFSFLVHYWSVTSKAFPDRQE